MKTKIESDFLLNNIELINSEGLFTLRYQNKNYRINHKTYLTVFLLKSKKSHNQVVQNLILKGYDVSIDDIKNFNNHLIKQLDNQIVVSPFIFTIPLINSGVSNLIGNKLSFLFKPIFVFLSLSSFLILITFITDSLADVEHSSKYMDYVLGFFIYFLSILFHEFGHVSALKYYGQPCGEIGFGLYLYFPCFYSNVSNAWALHPKQRMIVNLAGIYFQCIYLLPIILLYVFTQNYTFMFATISVLFSFLFNLNPFLKFDGYWVVSDALNVNNLHKVSKDVFAFFITKKENHGFSLYRKMNSKKRIFIISYTILSYSFYLFFAFFFIPRKILLFNYTSVIKELNLFLYDFKIPDINVLKQVFFIGISFFIMYRMIKNFYSIYKSASKNS